MNRTLSFSLCALSLSALALGAVGVGGGCTGCDAVSTETVILHVVDDVTGEAVADASFSENGQAISAECVEGGAGGAACEAWMLDIDVLGGQHEITVSAPGYANTTIATDTGEWQGCEDIADKSVESTVTMPAA